MKREPETDRRRYKRMETMLDANVQIFMPDEADHTAEKKGFIQNIGEGGMKLIIPDIPVELYRKLLAKVRRAKVSFVIPNTNALKKLIGRMVWLDYYQDNADCSCGLYFESIHPQDRKDLCDYIDRLEHPRSDLYN